MLNTHSYFTQLNEDQFDGIFHFAPIGMAKASLDGELLEVNNSFGTFMGRSKNDLYRVPINDFTHPEDLTSNIHNRVMLVEGQQESFSMEKRYRHKLGHWINGMLYATIIKDTENKPSHFIAQVMDLTEMNQYQIELKRREEQISQLESEIEAIVFQYHKEISLAQKLQEQVMSLDVGKEMKPGDKIWHLKQLAASIQLSGSLPYFLKHIDHRFCRRLLCGYENLSPNDLKLCALLRMNLSTKQMATIMGISPDSANKARYRLRRKLQLSPDEDLIQFIMSY